MASFNNKLKPLLLNCTAFFVGFSSPLLLWFYIRERYLGIRIDMVSLPAYETIDERLFTYVVFGFGMAAAAFLARGWHRYYVAPLAGFISYIGLICSIQNLFVNPDVWKIWERGYIMRSVEIVSIGIILAILARNPGSLRPSLR